MDENVDSDLLELKHTVEKAAEKNTDEHRAIQSMVQMNANRLDRLTLIQEDQQRIISRFGTTLYGNGNVGLTEDMRGQKAFSATLTKMLWVAATVGVAAAVTGLISLARTILTP